MPFTRNSFLTLHEKKLAYTPLIHIIPQIIEELSYRDTKNYGFTCLPSLLRPESRGNITLVSSDSFDYPRISPNYLNKEYDLDILVKGRHTERAYITIIVLPFEQSFRVLLLREFKMLTEYLHRFARLSKSRLSKLSIFRHTF